MEHKKVGEYNFTILRYKSFFLWLRIQNKGSWNTFMMGSIFFKTIDAIAWNEAMASIELWSDTIAHSIAIVSVNCV